MPASKRIPALPPNWSVVATADEPAALVLAFALHHLELGAAQIHLFLDGPNPEAEAVLRDLPQVQLVVCDTAHWAASVRRQKPKLHTGRQLVNANIAYAQTRSDWLLHCDCDEFVRDGAALTGELSDTGPDRVYLKLPVAERAYLPAPVTAAQTEDPFDGIFRFPMSDFATIGPQIYGDLAPFLKDGVTGHRAGKAVVRTGLPISMGIHSPDGPPPHKTARSRLLHFDGLTRLHYQIKLLRRAHEPPISRPLRHGPARIAQFDRLRGLVDHPDQARALVEQLKGLTARQIDDLRATESLDERRFRPLGHNPLADGLTVSALDAALRLRYRDFLIAHAPGWLTVQARRA